MDEETQDKLVTVIRDAYRSYPESDSTVDKMIAQALRIGFVRGQAQVRSP